MGNAKQRHRREDSRLASRLLTCYDSTCVCTTEQAKKATSFEMTSTSINLPSKRPRCLTDLNLIISSLLTPPGTSQIPVCHLGIRGHTPPKVARTHLPIPIDERISERITKKSPSTHTAHRVALENVRQQSRHTRFRGVQGRQVSSRGLAAVD
jgi:hypothetical protein